MDNTTKWAVNVVTKLPTYVDGHAALLGDAVSTMCIDVVTCTHLLLQAHGMTPHQGAGAGQGFEVRVSAVPTRQRTS